MKYKGGLRWGGEAGERIDQKNKGQAEGLRAGPRRWPPDGSCVCTVRSTGPRRMAPSPVQRGHRRCGKESTARKAVRQSGGYCTVSSQITHPPRNQTGRADSPNSASSDARAPTEIFQTRRELLAFPAVDAANWLSPECSANPPPLDDKRARARRKTALGKPTPAGQSSPDGIAQDLGSKDRRRQWKIKLEGVQTSLLDH